MIQNRSNSRLWWFVVLVGITAAALAGQSSVLAQDRIGAGKELFEHRWNEKDPLSPDGDGLGPMFNQVSCSSCHHLGGSGGAGGPWSNIDLLTVVAETEFNVDDAKSKSQKLHPDFWRSSTVLLHASSNDPKYLPWRRDLLGFDAGKVKRQNMKKAEAAFDQKIANLPPVADVRHYRGCTLILSHRNSTSLFGAGLIDRVPESVLKEVAAEQSRQFPGVHGRLCRDHLGRVGRFGWRGQVARLNEFVLAACANEVGLQTKNHDQASNPLVEVKGLSKINDLSLDQCESLMAFISSLPAPQQILPEDQGQVNLIRHGEKLFETIGCAACHVRDLGSVQGIYSDLLLHDLGPGLEDPLGANPERKEIRAENTGITFAYGAPEFVLIAKNSPLRREWKTPPLWGVRETAPYLHDGRVSTLAAAIAAHGGEAQQSATRFANLDESSRNSLLGFLNTLAGPKLER